MPTPYTPAGTTFPPFPWNLVKDGEVYNFDSIQQSSDPAKGLIAKCMDGIAYVYVRQNSINGTQGASRTRVIDTVWVPTTGGAWTQNIVGGWTTASALTSQIMVPILADTVPNGATITGFRAYVAPNTGRASLAGLTQPAVALASISAFGVVVSVASVSDTSGSVAAYETPHTITSGAISEVVDRTQKRYALLFNSEFGGGNALANGQLLNATITFTAP